MAKEDYQKRIAAIADEITKLAPNLRAFEKFENINNKLSESKEVWEKKKLVAKEAEDNYQAVRAKRIELFTKAFEHVSSKIDGIYKELTKSPSFPQVRSMRKTLIKKKEEGEVSSA